ncbi:hypothetical protein PTKIN_Ptkin02bG0000500 [Pterospermum kingtungense]
MGSIEAFYQANMECIKKSNMGMGYNSFCDRDSNVYIMPRYLPPTLVSDAVITDSVIGDGCILNESRKVSGGISYFSRCKIKGTVVGMRTKIRNGAIIEDSVIMGSDVYQIEDADEGSIEGIPIGIGENSQIRKAIADKNARIGEMSRYMINKDNVEEGDREANSYIISGGILVALRSAKIPDTASYEI